MEGVEEKYLIVAAAVIDDRDSCHANRRSYGGDYHRQRIDPAFEQPDSERVKTMIRLPGQACHYFIVWNDDGLWKLCCAYEARDANRCLHWSMIDPSGSHCEF